MMAVDGGQNPEHLFPRLSAASRICFVMPAMESYTPRAGGAIATVTRKLAGCLVDVGHDVTVVTLDDGYPAYAEGTVVKVPPGPGAFPSIRWHRALRRIGRTRGWRWSSDGIYLSRASRVVHRASPPFDVIVLANDPASACAMARRHPRVRCILWLHNYLEGPSAQWLSRLPGNVSLVAVSDAVRQWTSRRYSIAPERIAVIHNGVDGSEFFPREGFAEPVEPLRVISHGRVDPNKGHHVGARAVAELRRRGSPATFTLLGGIQTFGMPPTMVEEYVERLEADVSDAGGQWMDRRPATEVAGILRTYDVACALSSSDEPFSLAALESMASGLALISTGTGGMAEVVGDAAELVEPGDAMAVADAIERLLEDPGALARAKQRSVDQAALFSWHRARRSLEELLAKWPGQ